MARDLEVLELGNHGIDPGTWTGWDGPNERVAQGYPQQGDLPPQPATADAQWPQLPPARTRLEPAPEATDVRLEEALARGERMVMLACGVALVFGVVIGFGLCLLTPWSPL